MTAKSRLYFQGLMTAAVKVAEITGKQPMDGMSEREWKMIHELNAAMIELAKAEAERLDAA